MVNTAPGCKVLPLGMVSVKSPSPIIIHPMSTGVLHVFINSIHSLVLGGTPSLPVGLTSISFMTIHCANAEIEGINHTHADTIITRRILSTDLF